MKSINLFIFTLLLSLSTGFFLFAQENEAELKFFNLAESYRQAGEYANAIVEYESIILINPNEPKYYFNLGICQASVKHFEKAIKSFEKVLELDTTNQKADEYLARLFQQTNRYNDLATVLDKQSDNEEDLIQKVTLKKKIIGIFLQNEDYLSAYGYAYKEVNEVPNCVASLYINAKTKNYSGQYAEAKESAQKGIELLQGQHPELLSDLNYELGFAHYYLEEYKEKEAAFRNVNAEKYKAKLAKLSTPYLTAIAVAYHQLFELELAEEFAQIALKMDGSYHNATKLSIKIEKEKTSKNSQIDLYKNGIAGRLEKLPQTVGKSKDDLIKQLAKEYNRLIEMCLYTQEYEEATNVCNEALGLFENSIQAHHFYFLNAISSFKSDKVPVAILFMEKALEANGLSTQGKMKYTFALAHIYHQSGELDKAKQLYAKVKRGNYFPATQNGYEEIINNEKLRGIKLGENTISAVRN